MKKIAFDFKSHIEKLKKPKKWMIITAIIVVLLIILSIILASVKGFRSKSAMTQISSEETVERQNITSSITGTAVVLPKDQYEITALVSGDVLSANFEQGDTVSEGDILYTIDSTDAQNSIKSADIALSRSQDNLSDALEAKNDLNIKANTTGVIKKLYIKNGDNVNAGAQIADIYDDSYLLLTIPFNDTDADAINTGASAQVQISGTTETLLGTVTYVAASAYAKAGNMLVRDVKIKVKNPGTLMTTNTATATVSGAYCNDSGTFEYLSSKTVTAKASGEVSKINLYEGSRVSANSVIAYLTSDSADSTVKNASRSLEEARISRDNASKKLEDYTITAPISGTVVRKNVKAGDKLDSSNMQTAMAVIYDMSALEFELSVDELDINSVSVGQQVVITADALDGKIYNGEVSTISINGTTSGGVTTYPVTVSILDFDDELLPGMNIDVEIITTSAENVLAIPVSAVNRGNTVYVKGEKTDENDNAPEGFKTVTVETGVYNNEYIEIKSGLKEGDIVHVTKILPSGNNEMNPMAAMGAMHGGGMGGGMPPSGMPSGGGMPSGSRMPSGGAPGGMGGGMR